MPRAIAVHRTRRLSGATVGAGGPPLLSTMLSSLVHVATVRLPLVLGTLRGASQLSVLQVLLAGVRSA